MEKKLGGEEIFRGSLVLFVMINIFNFLNYVFHFAMARFLGPADYGVLAVLMSIVYIFNIPVESIQTVISRYTSKFNLKENFGKIKYLLVKSIRRIILFSFVLFLIYLAISFFISYFVRIELGLIIFTGILIFGNFLQPIVWGVMQGRKKFKSLGASMILHSFLKLILAIVFVILGFKVYGAMAGVILGVLFTIIISFGFLREIVKTKIDKTEIKGIYSYSFPVIFALFSITMMASLDIIFAKRFFAPIIAGQYAVASMLGKMIFFGTIAVSKAMFPLTSENYDKGKKTKSLFKKAFLMVFGICILAVLVFSIFPELVIGILFGKIYVEVSSLLVFIGIAFSLISLSNLILMYALSINKKKVSLFFIFVILEILTFSFFHSNLKEFVIAFMIINFIMFFVSLIFIKD